jgi:hypothetical protein
MWDKVEKYKIANKDIRGKGGYNDCTPKTLSNKDFAIS